jgi:hypothetical protein
MPKWEYDFIKFDWDERPTDKHEQRLKQLLNQKGQDGWDVILIAPGVAWIKRLLTPELGI